MKILITGGCGFVGSNIANELKDIYDITVVDDLSFGDEENLDNDVFVMVIDFNNLSAKFVNQFDVLIHCATANINYAITNPIKTFKLNALNTINLFKKFKGKIIYTSTSSVYGNATQLPTTENAKEDVYNAYDQSKLIAEKYLQLRGNYTTLRLSNVYGVNQRPSNPYAGVIGRFIDQAITHKPLTVFGKGFATRDYTYISDVVEAVRLCIIQKPKNKEMNISAGCEVSTYNLAEKIADIVGERYYIKYVDGRVVDKIMRRLLDSSLAKEELGWKAKIGINKGLKQTINWHREEYG